MKMQTMLKRNTLKIITLVSSIVLGFIAGLIVLLISGYNPLHAMGSLFAGIFGRPRYILWVLVRSVPLILTGLSVAIAYHAGLFNIGAEGQFIVGALVAALVGYHVRLPMILHIPFVLLCSMIGGAAWSSIAGYLKVRFGIHEVISTILLNWVALYLNNFVLKFPAIKRPDSEGSYKVLDTARIDIFAKFKAGEQWIPFQVENPALADLLKASISTGVIIAIIAAIVIHFLMKRTALGYEIKAVGFNASASEYQGIGVKRVKLTAMGISGALAGLGGSLHVLGVTHEVARLATMEGFGFDGIAVALIGNSHPIGILGSSFFFAGLKYGAVSIQRDLGAPSEIISIMIGTIVFFVAIPYLFKKILEAIRRNREKKHVD